MARVRIRPSRGNGRVIAKSERVAAKLVELGAYEYVDDAPAAAAPAPAPEPQGDDLESLTVAELRDRAEGLDVEREDGRTDLAPTKADLVRALSGGTYSRRDMRAE